jgi:predicted acetyltransferase
MTTFGSDADDDPGGGDRMRVLLAAGRAWAAFDRGAMVATAGTYGLTVGVPGSTMAMAGLTMVAVRPTHRRRGILGELIRLHLDDARARGESISGLWASEATIYGRFGYGVAVESAAIELATRGLTVAAIGEPDRCEWLDEPAALVRLPAIYARAIAGRPGALHRDEVWWRERRFLEVPFMRGSASLRRHVVARRGAEDVGYVVYRQRPRFEDGLPVGATELIALIAIDPRAEASLWRFVAGIDLFPIARWGNAPADSVLPWIVSNPRQVLRRQVDTLWLRIDDVAAALVARRYPVDGELRLAAGDATWGLVIEGGRARCGRVEAAPELRFEGTALGSVFLGGVSVAALARAGRITGAPEAIARADRMFAWPVAAWCPEMF